MRIGALAILLGLLTGCAAATGTPRAPALPAEPERPLAAIDHPILGIDDLQRGIEELERLTGVRAVYGGAHPTLGTHNALISLGRGAYLEILAPNPEQPVDSPMTTGLRSLDSLTLVGWGARVDDVDAVSRALEAHGMKTTEPTAGSRLQPDGGLLEWVAFGVEGPFNPVAPFYIRWSDRSVHPSDSSPGGCTLASLRLVDPSAAVLRTTMMALRLEVSVEEGPAPRIGMVLRCPRGTVEL